MTIRVHLDYETRSELSVKDVGAAVYAAHPSTSILCLAYRVDDGPVVRVPFHVINNSFAGFDTNPALVALAELAANPDVIFVAHNAFFEQCIWKYIMVRRHGYPVIAQTRWRCTAAKAAYYALPRKLEKVGAALRLPVQKDMEGNRVMMKLSRPRRPSKSNPNQWWTPDVVPDDFARLYAYNADDVEVESYVDDYLRELTFKEQAIWFMDQRMNHRGVKVDLPAVRRAVQFLQRCADELLVRFSELTGGYVEKPSQRDRFMAWLEGQGVLLSDLQAATVDRLLADHKKEPCMPDGVAEALRIRRQLGRTSTAKYQAMLDRVSEDGRLKDILLYCGASRTGRWSGRGVQLQNLVRPKVDIYETVEDLMRYDYETFSFLYPVMETIAELVRGMLIADDGMVLYVADFSAIEARVNAWLAGEEDLLDAFRNDICNYCQLASTIYNRHINKKDHPEERQVGKVGELALGYQGGINAFAQMADTYRLDMAPVYDIIWPTTTPEERAKAIKAWESYSRSSEDPISMEAALAADVVKQRYRLTRTKIVQSWYDVEEAAIEAVRTGKPVTWRKVTFFLNGVGSSRFLHIKLPSGRCLSYHKPKLKESKTPWGKPTFKLTYWGEDSVTHQYRQLDTYGGKLIENITQAVARDLMAEAFVRIEKAKYIPVLQVHDEAVSEAPIGFGSLDEYTALMSEVPAWAEGLPVKAESWTGPRYKK